MPIVSGGGAGNTTAEVVASGKVLPVGSPSGVTVDTTTYDNTITGAGKLTTLVFGANTGLFAVALTGDVFPRWLMSSDSGGALALGDGTYDAWGSGPGLSLNGANINLFAGSGSSKIILSGKPTAVDAATAATHAPRLNQLSPKATIASGALPTVQLVSATAAQILTTRDAETITPCTFNPGAATTATVTVELSSDNLTYSTLAVVTEPAGVALDGTILPIRVRVPAGWYLKLTANAQAVLGLTTYY